MDPEATGGVTTTITWSVSGRDGGDFTIDRETGALTFRTLPGLRAAGRLKPGQRV